MRLCDYLRQQGQTNRQIRQNLENGKVFLNNVPCADGGRSIEGFEVTVKPDARRLVVGRDPVLLHHDAHIAVAYKPSGWLSVPAARRRRDDDMVSWVRRILGDAHAVHRLDEATSGLMMVALSETAQTRLREALSQHGVARRYLAIVRHNFPLDEQTSRTILVRNRGDGKRGSALADEQPAEGKRAVTHFRCVERLVRDASLVEARLETGRTHQVRIHLSEAGFPVLGDKLYGSQSVGSASPRLALHAWHLRFEHPMNGEMLEFKAPLADDLEKLRRFLAVRRTSPRR